MDIQRYTIDAVRQAARALKSRFETGGLHWLDLSLGMSAFRFRDERGVYWFLDARTGDWYRFDPHGWQAASDPPQMLEGPHSASMGPRELPDMPEETPIDASLTSVKALESMVQIVRKVYVSGQITSADAEQLLGRHYLIDKRGRFWTVGVRSGRWYAFEGEAWRAFDAPPALDSLTSPVHAETSDAGRALSAVPDEVLPATIDFLVRGGGSLPERVTDPWDPPSGFPDVPADVTLHCGACGTLNPLDSRFCTGCGARLE